MKKLIEITEQSIERKKRSDTFSFDGICYLFAKSIVGYAKSAFDNMLLGHFDEALMITRAIIENNVCLDIILRYEKQGLWKYYLVQSYRNTVRCGKVLRKEHLKCFDELCERYNISEVF